MTRINWIYSWWAHLDKLVDEDVAEFVRTVLWDQNYRDGVKIPVDRSLTEEVNRPTEDAALNSLVKKAWIAEQLRYYHSTEKHLNHAERKRP